MTLKMQKPLIYTGTDGDLLQIQSRPDLDALLPLSTWWSQEENAASRKTVFFLVIDGQLYRFSEMHP